MDGLFAFLGFVAMICVAIGIVVAIVNKLKKKPLKKSLRFTGISFLVLVIAFIGFAVTMPDEVSIGGAVFSGTFNNINLNRQIIFDGKNATLYENGKQIQTGTYKYYNETHLLISYKDFGEFYIFDDAREMLYQGDRGAVNLGEVEYVKEGVVNADLTPLTIERPAEKQIAQKAKTAKMKSIRNMRLHNSQNFSEGRAWVKYHEPLSVIGAVSALTKGQYIIPDDVRGKEKIAVIDTQGQIVWESDGTAWDYFSDFKDGLAHIYKDKGNSREHAVIDSNGKITLLKKQDDHQVLRYFNGRFLVAQHVSNFNTNEWLLGVIDKDGKILNPLKSYDNEYGAKLDFSSKNIVGCQYLGDNIFNIHLENSVYDSATFGNKYPEMLLNVETQRIILRDTDLNEIRSFITTFENGYAVIYRGGGGRGRDKSGIFKLKTDGIFEKVPDSWISDFPLQINPESPERLMRGFGSRPEFFSDGLIFRQTGGFDGDNYWLRNSNGAYYSITGEKLIDFPEFRGKNGYIGGAFRNGYAAMAILGADGNSYYTIIDKNGNRMFEPITGLGGFYISPDGKYVTLVKNGEISILDINGKLLKSIKNYQIESQRIYNVSNDVIRITGTYIDFYVNIETGTVIGEQIPSSKVY